MAGTMPYMAPEQLQGKPRKASDQYSLGIVVYEWISGACPFQGTALEIAAQHLHVPPPSLRTKNPMIPLAVEEVVLRALTKNPQQRFTNVWAFAAALEQACQAAWGGSVGLPEVLTSEERIAPTGSSHAQHDPNESIYWTRRATDSSTIQQDAQVDTSGNRPAVSDRTPIQALPDSTFLFNQSLLDPSEFYGRVRERMVLLDRVRKGESTSIVGSRRIGKTWLMQYLRLVAREELGSRFLVGYLDATAQRCATIAGFSASALEVLTTQKDEFTSSDEGLLRLEQTVRQLSSQGHVSVLCIDEFEGLSTRPEFDLHFFTTMRALTQEGLCLVVVSKEPLIKIVGEKGKTSGFFNVFEQRKLAPFDLKEAQQFVQSKGDQVNLTELERQRILGYGQINGAYWPIRLQLVGKLLMEDKILALREQEPHFYRPADPAYWQDFQSRLEDIYRGAVL